MLKKIANKNSNRFVSKWVIFSIDLLMVVIAAQFAYLLRFNFDLKFIDEYPLGWQFLFISITYLCGFMVTKPYSGIIRHTSVKDLEKLFVANFIALFSGLSINLLLFSSESGSYYRIPISIFIIQFLLVTFSMAMLRFGIKSLYATLMRMNLAKRKVIVYGAGKAGLMTKNILEQEAQLVYQIVAFVDDNPSKVGKKLEGVQVISRRSLKNFVKENKIEEAIIAIEKIAPVRKRVFIDQLIACKVVVKNIPPVNQWIDGEFSSRQIKQVRIEDLLERLPIELDKELINDKLRYKTVFVTGAAGSIGSELVRQVLGYEPNKLVLIDQAESPLHELMVDLKQKSNGLTKDLLETYVCDVNNADRIEQIFKKHQPDVVYHAAAYKHVPLMEENPSEAVKVNIFGTKIVADLSVKYKVGRFVLVSTDKAVNPTNVMGATKRIAEMYCKSSDSSQSTRFITTRFGNVLGSNGSVIPLFRKQIENGGPITVTHKDITRFFMTIAEACELVIEAGAMGEGGEIFVFDMGEPVKIYDLAKKMIHLSGFNEHEIEIKIVGLRPGEKLYEEVLSIEENISRTYHPKINIAKVRSSTHDVLSNQLSELADYLKEGNDIKMVRMLKSIVPEFKSKNSYYQQLDEERSIQKRVAI